MEMKFDRWGAGNKELEGEGIEFKQGGVNGSSDFSETDFSEMDFSEMDFSEMDFGEIYFIKLL